MAQPPGGSSAMRERRQCAGVLTRRLLPLCLLYPLCDGFASGSAARARAIPAFALPHPPGECEGFRVQGMRVSPRIQQQVGARPAGRRFALGERRRGRTSCVSGLRAAMIPEGSGGGGRGEWPGQKGRRVDKKTVSQAGVGREVEFEATVEKGDGMLETGELNDDEDVDMTVVDTIVQRGSGGGEGDLGKNGQAPAGHVTKAGPGGGTQQKVQNKKENPHQMASNLEELLDKVRDYVPASEQAEIAKAYHFAEKAHAGQLRKSGEAYFTHPVGVASIIADMKLDSASVITGLLHDTVEDCVCTTLEVIQEEFGAEVAQLVDGVTKIGQLQFTSKEEQQAENFRKMIVAMARDIRVILVKLADRTHNIRTLKFVPPHKQRAVARETIDLYAPLAHRLGIFWLKTELEDTSLRYLEPDVYEDLKMMVSTKKEERQAYTDEVTQLLTDKVSSVGLTNAQVTGRAKHFYSIYQKMRSRGLTHVSEVHDLIAFRILVDDMSACYQALGVVHTMWKPVPGRFKDYIALAKPNMYQSLHTTVIGPGGQRIEVQIRTKEMHRVAEEGIAAHWMYKGENSGVEEARRFAWLRQLVEWVQQLNDPQEFLHTVKEDLFEKEVFVFSPKGDLYALPKGSSLVDFAYRVHSELGNRCIGGKVNGRMVALKYQVQNGDTVEVLTSSNQTPHKDWLGLARTSKAQARIRAWIKAQQREKSVALGRTLLNAALQQNAISGKAYNGKLAYILSAFNLPSEEQLLAAVGYGHITVDAFIQVLIDEESVQREKQKPLGQRQDEGVQEAIRQSSHRVQERARKSAGGVNASPVLVGGERNMMISYCRECNALYGEDIRGVITRGRGIKVHRVSCQRLLESDQARRISVSWDPEARNLAARPIEIEVECEDAPGMLASMSKAISAAGVNIASVVLKKLPAGHGLARFEIMVATAQEVERVFKFLQGVKGVLRATRKNDSRQEHGSLRRKAVTRLGRPRVPRSSSRSSAVPPKLQSDE